MAGGPNAAIMMCLHFAGKAARVAEGIEDDLCRCEECGGRFGIDWSHGQITRPCNTMMRGVAPLVVMRPKLTLLMFELASVGLLNTGVLVRF